METRIYIILNANSFSKKILWIKIDIEIELVCYVDTFNNVWGKIIK